MFSFSVCVKMMITTDVYFSYYPGYIFMVKNDVRKTFYILLIKQEKGSEIREEII